MKKIYGTGVYDFRRHRVAEYPVSVEASVLPESDKGSNLSGSITLSEIQRDRLTKIASANWAINSDSGVKKPFSADLVNEIYYSELTVKGGRKPVQLQRVMILEVSQYLENYLWPNFDPETASFEHVMSIILMVNEKFRENMAAWTCFYNRKEMFKAFLERVLCLKEGRVLTIAEKTNYLLFMINAFQSLEDEIVSEKIMRLASLECWHSLSYGRFQMELCLNENLIKKWRRIAKRVKDAAKRGEPFDPMTMVEAKFLRNLIEEFLEVLDSEVFPTKPEIDMVDVTGTIEVDDACICTGGDSKFVQGQGSGSQVKRCFRCGGPHLIRDCTQEGPTCYECGGIGHISRQCPNQGNRRDSKSDQGRGGRPSERTVQQQVIPKASEARPQGQRGGQPQGHVYALTREEAEGAHEDVITDFRRFHEG